MKIRRLADIIQSQLPNPNIRTLDEIEAMCVHAEGELSLSNRIAPDERPFAIMIAVMRVLGGIP